MGRFERHDSEASHLPENLGIATEGLRSTIDAEVARIVENAQSRAAEIEDQALEKAARVEEDSEQQLETAFVESRQRLAQMLAQIDAVEVALGESVRALRAEAQQLTANLNRSATEPFGVEEPVPPAPEDAQIEPHAAEAPPETDSDSMEGDAHDPEVRELIRQQLATLAEAGRTRDDAERMLLRFRQGEQYFDLLDEIYPDATPERRGLLRRRKHGS